MQYDTPSLLELPDDWPRAVAGGLDDVDALVDDGLGISTVVRRVEGRQEGDIHSEGVLGQFPALLDLLAQVCRRWEDESRDDAKPAGVGDGTGQLGVPDVLEQEPGVSISSCDHDGEAVRLIPSHRRTATCHLSDMSWRMGTLEVAKEQLADSGHVPSYRPARRALWFSSVECLQVGPASRRGLCLPRVAYSPRMPRRRVSSVFHGMLLVLSGSEEESEEGSRGLCCSLCRCGYLSE